MNAPRFGIGTRFNSRGKNPRECTVVDIFTTRNNAGDVVKIRYVAEHEFLGNTVKDYDVGDATIAMGLISSAHHPEDFYPFTRTDP